MTNTTFGTYTGRLIDLQQIRPEDICIEDIAHGLAHICRFNGQCKLHYSVAQHSVLVADHFVPGCSMWASAFLHDAAEAYIGDITAPVKNLIPEFRQLEVHVRHAISVHFKVNLYIDLGKIELIDMRVRAAEIRDLCSSEWPAPYGVEPYIGRIKAQPAAVAEELFLTEWRTHKGIQDANN